MVDWMHCLFVYGTLRSGFRNRYARMLAARAVLLGPARMRGRLYHLQQYPGMRTSACPGEWVVGELYMLPGAASLSALDRYEGPRFRRKCCHAFDAAGRRRPAWVYEYLGRVSESHRIPSGDYFPCGVPHTAC